MHIKEKIANTYVSAILNFNGGAAGSRTLVHKKPLKDYYSLVKVKNFAIYQS